MREPREYSINKHKEPKKRDTKKKPVSRLINRDARY